MARKIYKKSVSKKSVSRYSTKSGILKSTDTNTQNQDDLETLCARISTAKKNKTVNDSHSDLYFSQNNGKVTCLSSPFLDVEDTQKERFRGLSVVQEVNTEHGATLKLSGIPSKTSFDRITVSVRKSHKIQDLLVRRDDGNFDNKDAQINYIEENQPNDIEENRPSYIMIRIKGTLNNVTFTALCTEKPLNRS